jgi:plasmid stabilization system protein ParE
LLLLWRPMALADRERIMDYIARNNPAAAVKLDELN